MTPDYKTQTLTMIDSLKTICANYGLGNDGNEFKIISQIFLYKYLTDKYAHTVKQLDEHLANNPNWEKTLADMTDDEREMLNLMVVDTAKLEPHHLISSLKPKMNEPNFAKLFDDTLIDIGIKNADIYSVQTNSGAKIVLFDRLSEYITDTSQRDAFMRAIIDKLSDFSFEHIFHQKFDFYAQIFEYLIKDYNSNSGGKYAEYYTPHAVARIMANILVPSSERGKVKKRFSLWPVGRFWHATHECRPRHRRR